MKIALVCYLLVVAVMSVVCFIAYGWDKKLAERGGRRLSERTLHTLALLGGWPGALVGQEKFRHKTKKVMFRLVVWSIALLHIFTISAIAWLTLSSPQSGTSQ